MDAQVATISSALVVDKCGRRLLLLVSQAFMAVAMGGMGSFFYMKYHSDSKHPFPMDALSWVPLTSLLIFVFSFSIGIGPICKSTVHKLRFSRELSLPLEKI